MKNWIPFSDQEYDQIWDRIYRDIKFEPSLSNFPSFQVPYPFITYNISDYFGGSADLDAYDDLEENALDAFIETTLVDEYILALDWQHECYWVNPRLEFEKDEFGEWTIPIFPNGDYYFFIQKDFKWGYLGNPWERSITIFGKELINAFEKHKPKMFHKILRQG
ncbi:DUF2716 domain-containing protein [Bacillus sp. RO2]|uniref:DUF2716 domain-containing protein n=1 Tax=Bacillus sp. RO2 TaxID=2723913 RepID=UPI00145F0493|nr:DUF2716 domain-containing protein [Bacillus sp. RO2]NMH74024.1 DUF2716 domain-containing protein [Bacillus sp. RO2]